MALLPVKIPPGMFRNGTEYESAGRWYDGNLVRWENGQLKPMGGWQALLSGEAAFTGTARGGFAWQDNGGFKHIAVGTEQKFYTGTGGVFTDTTPAGFTPGRSSSITGPGYGAGPYGKDNYGTPRSGSVTLELLAATWSMDTYGEDLLSVMTSDTKIYDFSPSLGTNIVLANSPSARAVMVTNEGYILALGAGGVGKKIQWADLGNPTTWTPATTNSAGSISLQTGGNCKTGRRVGLQNLVWTTTDLHLVNFIGTPGIYGPIQIGTGCGLIAANAVVVTGEGAFWWSPGGFFLYNGIVNPLNCEVQDYIFRNINADQVEKIYGFHNSRFFEVGWFFPSAAVAECDSYVIYNYKLKCWYFGLASTLARTTWIDGGVFSHPLAVDAAGLIYEQEIGFLANGSPRTGQVFARSGPAQVGNGDKIVYANLMLPDADVNPASITIKARTRFAPNGPETIRGPWSPVPNSEGYVPVRFAGRQAAFHIDQVADTDWSLGTVRFEVAGGGGR